MTYYGLEPWGEERADYRAASIGLTVAQFNSIGAKTKQLKLEDFLLRFGKPKARRRPQMTGDQMAASFAKFAAAHNAFQAASGGKS